MSEQTTEAPTARRHIIKRPRLTRLLDETTARIILLVAPAGYGKTTLAREWCESLQGTIVWYQAGPSAQDVVALAKDLSCALEDVVPGVGRGLRPYLRGLDSSEVDVHDLAKRLAADLTSWPESGLLVIDDYQYAVLSDTSDTFLGLIAEHAPLRLLLATRVAPRWASARHFIYGQVLQLERAQLSMTQSEVDQALSRGSPNGGARICALAGGWPAVIGLAALTSGANPPPAAFADTLHAYFAQELFDAVDPSLQAPLIKLAVLPRITHALAKVALGADPSVLLTEADRVGFLTPRGETYELHPLLRQFLLGKGSFVDSHELLAVRRRLLAVLIADHCWDDVFTLIQETEMISELPRLLRASLDGLLKEGRIATIRTWVEFARSRKLDDPIISLAQSESSLRSGELTQARFFATRAYRRLPASDDWIFRSLSVAGLIAHLADDYANATAYYKKAEAAARSSEEVREALWGQFTVAFHLEREESETLLQKFESAAADQTPDDALRVANGRFRTTCLAHTSLRDVLDELSANARLVELASNPHVICGFLIVWAQCSMLTANYSEAIERAHTSKEATNHYGLKFAFPYVSGIQSFALLGLRRFTDAQAAIDGLVHEAKALGDFHSLINASVARARLLLAIGDVMGAITATDERRFSVTSPSMHGELLAVHSLALACAGERRAARASIARTRSVSRAIETETTALAAEAVLSSDENALRRLLQHLRRSRHYDAFVAAYRSHPALLVQSATLSEFRELLHEVISMAGDVDWAASSLGLNVPSSAAADGNYPLFSHQLSPREFEVLGLVAHGLSNHEIARHLYISEATVKVHLRHVFEKLGVRSRTQAALHPAGRRASYATADMRSASLDGESA